MGKSILISTFPMSMFAIGECRKSCLNPQSVTRNEPVVDEQVSSLEFLDWKEERFALHKTVYPEWVPFYEQSSDCCWRVLIFDDDSDTGIHDLETI